MQTTKPHGAGPRNLGAHERKTDPGLKPPELVFEGSMCLLSFRKLFVTLTIAYSVKR